eukprot:637385-Amphidinium_carterae.1
MVSVTLSFPALSCRHQALRRNPQQSRTPASLRLRGSRGPSDNVYVIGQHLKIPPTRTISEVVVHIHGRCSGLHGLKHLFPHSKSRR